MPRSAKIELTAHCDLACFFCAAHVRPRARGGMPGPLFERLVRELRVAVVVENVRRAREARDAIAAAGGHHCGLYASSLKLASGQSEVPAGVAAALGQWVDEHYELPVFGYERQLAAQAGVAGGGRNREASKPVPCWSLFTEVHITHEGRLSACCLDHSPRFDMGDLTQTRFVDAWSGERFRQLRAAHLDGTTGTTACRDCIAYQGPCAA